MSHQSGNTRFLPSRQMRRLEDHTVVLNPGKEEELRVTGYCTSIPKAVLSVLISVVTLGTLQLIFHWRPVWHLLCTSKKCDLQKATYVLLENQFDESFVEKVDVKPLLEPADNILKQQVDKLQVPDSSSSVYYSINRDGVDLQVSGGQDGNGPREDIFSTSEDEGDTQSLLKKENSEQKLTLRLFLHKRIVYFWDDHLQCFRRLHGLDVGTPLRSLHDEYVGFSEKDQEARHCIYGWNDIYVEVKSYWQLFTGEILNPFFIFQIFSVILWICEVYYYYAACIVFILVVSLTISLYETRKQAITLRDMVAHESSVEVLRKNGEIEEISSTKLVPGDVIIIPGKGCVMSCDAALICGNCIVNESMLTGESVPVTKTPLPNPPPTEGDKPLMYSADQHKRQTLFAGTHVIQTRYYGSEKVKAVVLQTGFMTLKGDLVRAILYPKPVGFKFYRDSMKFVGMLATIAAAGILYSVFVLLSLQACVPDIIYKALDIITIAVPPSLPAAMTVGTIYAQARLKKQGIYCISPQRINVCGKLKLICFDKTGTLTEDGLDFWGIVPLQDRHFSAAVQSVGDTAQGPIISAMATCHSLTIIDGKICGDPLDLKMFEATKWILEEPETDSNKFDTLVPTIVKAPTNETLYPRGTEDGTSHEIGIIRQFPFSSSLQRMSVVTRTLGSRHMTVYIKGSPEMVASLCIADTVPLDFLEVLQCYTMKGFRVLALGFRNLDSKFSWHHVQKVQRNELECDFTFLGLLVMQNALKEATTPIIHQLKKADIRTVMVTGDNMLTAISVARDCGMVAPHGKIVVVNAKAPKNGESAKIEWNYESTPDDNAHLQNTPQIMLYQEKPMNQPGEAARFHFALSGSAFGVVRKYFPHLMSRIVQRGTIFARMAPDQKTQLVEALQEIGYCVGMCGDGSNDCGALKTAHAGISLSEAEASVASPFTSRIPDISCVPTVIKEGRAALVTSFSVFKYMALYSIVQFVSVAILYTIDSNLGDLQFLYVDLVITTTVAILLGYNGAYPKLVKKRPPGSLFSAPILFSICFQVFLVTVVQLLAYYSLRFQPWFKFSPHEPHPCSPHHKVDENIKIPEGTVIFFVSSFQYILLAGAFSKGPPYRLPLWTNYLFVEACILPVYTIGPVRLMDPTYGQYLFLLDLIFLFLMTSGLMFFSPQVEKVANFLQIDITISEIVWYPVSLFGVIVLYGMLVFMVETILVDSALMKTVLTPFRCKKQPKNRYKRVEQEIINDPSWPPVGEVTSAFSYTTSEADTGYKDQA